MFPHFIMNLSNPKYEFKLVFQEKNKTWLHAVSLKFMQKSQGKLRPIFKSNIVPGITEWVWAEMQLHLMSLLISIKCTVFYSHSPFSLRSYLKTRVVKSGQGKDNLHIRTKAENALKLSQIPQRSLLYLHPEYSSLIHWWGKNSVKSDLVI